MRIVYLHQYFNRPTDRSGVRSYAMALELVNAGHEVHLVTTDRKASASRKRWRVETVDGITVHWLPVPYSNSMGRKERIRAFLSFAIGAAVYARKLGGDIVFATSTPLTIAIPGIFATAMRETPMVFEVRDLWPEVPIALGQIKNPLVRVAARALEKLAYRRSAHVVALSPMMRDGVVKQGYPANQITVIPNLADIGSFQGKEAEGAAWRQSREWLLERKMVLYCGTLGRANDVSYFVELAAAMRELDDEVRFVIVGDGAEQGKVRQRAQDLGVLDQTLYMTDRIPKTEVPAAFAAATVTMSVFAPIPELTATSPNKFFDSLAAGKPVAINYRGWQANALEASGAGLVLNSSDHRVAASQLYELLQNPQRLAQSSAAALNLAAESFSRDALTGQLRQVLEKVASDRNAKN